MTEAAEQPMLELRHALDARAGRRRPGLLVAMALGFFGLVGVLLVLAVRVALPGDGPHPVAHVYSRPIVDHVLDPATFAAIPQGDDAAASEAVMKTSGDARTAEPLSADAARLANARIGVAGDVGPPARPFRLAIGDGVGFTRALDCMTSAIYHEAANEPLDGQRAVAQVVINRTRHFAYPHSICAVVYQGQERATGCQFSFTCDGSLTRVPFAALWARARTVASMALGGLVYAPVGLSTHYHADYVVPYWAPTLVKQAVIGRHIFYRWPGSWGTTRSFAAAYDAAEPDIWAGRQTAGAPLPASGPPGTAPVAVDRAARPVLMAGSAMTARADGPASAPPVSADRRDRVYLMSREPRADAALPRRTGSVTGGVIMPGSVIMPVASGRHATVEQGRQGTNGPERPGQD